ncbi:MAG: Nif3-like dinuclear metal center hexameric protein [Planctomycetes bacterium]|nr:Nif3-like dinuclear metal center hexameric protein [Planctomycetota bacterium]
MKVADVHRIIQNLRSPSADTGPRDGLKLGNPEADVFGVAVTWMATRQIVLDAAQQHLNVIISHEPFFFDPMDDFRSFEQDGAFIEKMQDLLENRLIAYRVHDLWLEFPRYGVLDSWAETLALPSPSAARPGLRLFQIPPQPLRDFALEVKKRMRLQRILVRGPADLPVRRIALAVGPSLEIPLWREGLRLQADCLITGEATELALRFAEDSDLCVILTGHSHADAPGLRALAVRLQELLGSIPVHFLEVDEALVEY